MADALGNSIILVSLPLFVAQLPSPILASIPESLLIGILISLCGIVFSALQPLTGAVSDRMSRRKPFIIWGLVVMGFGTLAYVIAGKAIDIVFIRLVQGIGVALTAPAALALMAISSEKDTGGGSMGIYTGFRTVGFALGPLLGGYLQVTYGFNAVFIAGSAFLFLAVILVQVLVREQPADTTEARSKPFRLFDPGVLTVSLIALSVAMFLMTSAFSMITTLEPQLNAGV